MADVPKDLLTEIKKLEDLFTVDKAKLKEITTHFVSELEKGKLLLLYREETSINISIGLSVEGGSIVSCTLNLRLYTSNIQIQLTASSQ